MKTLVAIGEALIDFAPQQTGRQIKDTESFMPIATNVFTTTSCTLFHSIYFPNRKIHIFEIVPRFTPQLQ